MARPAAAARPLTQAERAGFRFEDVGAFDDAALATFLDPTDGGVAPGELGIAASGCDRAMLARIARCLPPEAAPRFVDGAALRAPRHAVARAQRHVLDQLFWPLVYWTRPRDYAELIRGEQISARVLDEVDIGGKVVCDIGAGSGRFALAAARRARHIIAVDAVPALLRRLRMSARRQGIHTIETRRGSFRALPLDDRSVDVAVACSAFTTTGPHGGRSALREAERIVRPGGTVAVIWPQDPAWFRAHGYDHVVVRGCGSIAFRNVRTAERLCALYYSADAARWVREHATADVPYSVLGVPPPNDVCLRRVP